MFSGAYALTGKWLNDKVMVLATSSQNGNGFRIVDMMEPKILNTMPGLFSDGCDQAVRSDNAHKTMVFLTIEPGGTWTEHNLYWSNPHAHVLQYIIFLVLENI